MIISCVAIDVAMVSSLNAVRGNVHEHVRHWGFGEHADDAALIVTELLGNAFRHGRPPVRVWLTADDGDGRPALRIGVSDAGPALDVDLLRCKWRHPCGGLSTDGRGLRLVDALSRSWGDQPRDAGHTVWAELDCDRRRDANDGCRRRRSDAVSAVPMAR
ncbi:ATP-binding protein [Streptomyces coelicoflavus]|uniref:ATP-binding protein n=1 Tax=Streptomyces coelicoflavus TaxID=285562 RepID=UPI003645C005